MKKSIANSVNFLRKTAIGGLFFLLPLALLAYILAQTYLVVHAISVPLHEWIPVDSPIGILLLFSASVSILVLICFFAGVIASRALGKAFSRTLEKQLTMVFPKYLIYKDLVAGNLKHSPVLASLVPVLVMVPEGYRLALKTDQLANGMCVVYFPGAPDSWIGSVVLVPAARVHPSDLSLNEAVAIFERLGRDSADLLSSVPPLE